MAIKSSLNSRNEQLQIQVLVHNINLSSQKISNSGTSSLCLRAKFIDPASFKIRQEEFVSLKKARDESHHEKNCIDFRANKTCLFVQLPTDITKNMNEKPLKVDVISKIGSEFIHLCETNIFFSDCNCKEKSSILEDNISVPIISKNIYNLVNPQGENSGTIELSFNLCSIKSITSDNEYKNLDSELKILPKIPEVISIESECPVDNLSNEDEIKAPKTPPKAKMGEPEFENLTTAEKMNDRKYRRSIYQTYPNEPTCGCGNSSINKISRVINCPGGCTSRCCSSARKKSGKRRNYKYISSNSSLRSRRLRGGGEGIGNLEYNYIPGFYQNNNYSRMQGGGGEAEANCDQNIDPNISPMVNDHQQCGCCSDNEFLNSVMQRKSDQPSIKKPCLGIDCLIKAFEDAQNFVDSIGRVPGLAGLGLMDPTESPYFGRNRDDEPTTKESKIYNEPSYNNQKINHKCSGVCNQKPVMTGRLGVIKEAIPVIPDLNGSVIPGQKVKRKDDKIEKKDGESSLLGIEEMSPCGEPRCRSKKKKINVDVQGNGILKGSKSKTQEKIDKTDSKSKSQEKSDKTDSKFDRRKSRSNPGSSGDRPLSKSNVKMPRRKFIYSAGDTYPGISCGHKTCNEPITRIPPNMGWMWHPQTLLGRLKPRVGWRPGAINSRLRQVLREVKASFWQGERPKSAPPRSKKRTTTKKNKSVSSIRKEPLKKQEIVEEEWKEPPPTLHIHRKEGVYYVTMYPIKDDKMDIPKLEIPTKPLQFKIMKNRDDASDISSSTASDMEIEFSPPAAVNRYRKKPNVVHVETQVKQQEIIEANKPPGSKKTEKKSGKEKKTKK